VSGPVNIEAPDSCKVIKVNSALEMYQQVLDQVSHADVFIACAAVADYRIAEVSEQKIKKSNDTLQLNLIKNPDIVADIAAMAKKPFTVGFAAETQDVSQYALQKLQKKGLDMIAANDVAKSGQGFNSDNNALTIFSQQDGQVNKIEIALASKQVVANQLVSIIADNL
ncbi:MAG: phosphopantothenoylcysteine decarboxylase, partial [Alteromonadaceae bacterium]